MAERIRAIWERIKDDIHRNPGLWIGLGISAMVLVLAYLAYRKKQLNTQSVVPANGYGIPDYGTSSGGGGTDTGLTYPGYSPYQPASPSVPISPISTPFTSPATAFPAFPSFNLTAPAGPFSGVTSAVASLISGNIQNPTAAQDIQHRGSLVSSYPVTQVIPYAIQNPTAAQTAQHVGTVASVQNPTATQDIQHRGSLPTAPTSYVIPTTIRPTTVTTRGRVA